MEGSCTVSGYRQILTPLAEYHRLAEMFAGESSSPISNDMVTKHGAMMLAGDCAQHACRQTPDARDATVFEHSQRMVFIKTRGRRTLAGEAFTLRHLS